MKKGSKHSLETLRKISRANRGRKMAPEVRKHLSTVRKGVKQSPEHVKKRTTATRAALKRPGPPNELCEICHLPSQHGRLAQDHDHQTGKNRGRLCLHCNQGLGHFKDDPRLLEQAIAYLRRWSE